MQMSKQVKRLSVMLVGLALGVGPAVAAESSGDFLTQMKESIYDSIEAIENGLADVGADPSAIAAASGLDHSDGALASGVGVSSAATSDPHTIIDEFTYAFTTDLNFVETLDCSEWQWIGICFSWRMTWTGPRFYTNQIVENYSRDTHIEVRSSQISEENLNKIVLPVPGEVLDERSPTDYMVGGIPTQITGMTGTLGAGLSNWSNFSENDIRYRGVDSGNISRDGHDYLFREALVMGNPESAFYDLVVGHVFNAIGWCRSRNFPSVPYYSSVTDFLSWRYMPTTETLFAAPYYAQHGLADIGDSFASIMPRTARVYTSSPFKAAVVTAARGMHIAASNESLYSGAAGLHVVAPMSSYASGSWTSNFYKTKQDHAAFKLEMIYPFQGEKCTRYKEESSFLSDERDLRFQEGNDYHSAAFKGYRPLRCCRRQGNHIADITVFSPKL
ncbi:hypothetical protein ACP3V3_02050 [Vibrio sp. PNB22_3_1]